MRKEVIGDAQLYLGDCLEVIPRLPRLQACITDPPYSSGGMVRGDRMQKTAAKYINTDSEVTFREDFSGDNRDQRAFLAWATMVFSALHRNAVPGAPILAFTDWRQLPTMTDAIQCGGWVWRNLATWWKPGVRMQRGRFSSSAEYVVYGSHGPITEGEKSPQNVLSFPPVGGEDKQHIAEKPVELLQTLVGVTPAGSCVTDPFMGSGTTGVACVLELRPFVGVELDRHMFDIACRRIEQAYKQRPLFEAELVKAPEQVDFLSQEERA
jgi:site-specific DNA-methyltransferase (adenine-specific)